jgi:hypothetical protein
LLWISFLGLGWLLPFLQPDNRSENVQSFRQKEAWRHIWAGKKSAGTGKSLSGERCDLSTYMVLGTLCR